MELSKVTTPVRVNLLISFMDIEGFSKISQALPDMIRLFDLLNNWAAIIIQEVDQAHGKVIKFIGDSCLAIFSEDDADAGVCALLSAKEKAEAFLQKEGFTNKMRVTGHVGEAVIGLFGTGSCKGIDVFGESVNTAAALDRGDYRSHLILSPQAFRKLTASTRKRFHEHTPPIVYIAEA
jgi:class 3 adenylate cyclase